MSSCFQTHTNVLSHMVMLDFYYQNEHLNLMCRVSLVGPASKNEYELSLTANIQTGVNQKNPPGFSS